MQTFSKMFSINEHLEVLTGFRVYQNISYLFGFTRLFCAHICISNWTLGFLAEHNVKPENHIGNHIFMKNRCMILGSHTGFIYDFFLVIRQRSCMIS